MAWSRIILYESDNESVQDERNKSNKHTKKSKKGNRKMERGNKQKEKSNTKGNKKEKGSRGKK